MKNDIDIARNCMLFYPNGSKWTWDKSLTMHVSMGGEANYFPFLEIGDQFIPFDGICIEQQLYAMEKGWTV